MRRKSPLPSDESIRRILIGTWDPRGHAIGRSPDHAYDRFIPSIRAQLQSSRSAEKLEQHLRHLERHSMGIVHADRARRRRAVVLLLALDYPKNHG